MQILRGSIKSAVRQLVGCRRRTDELHGMLFAERKVATYSDGCNICPIIVIATTGFPELSIGEALGPVHLKAIGLEVFLDAKDTICGDNDVIPIDAYLTRCKDIQDLCSRLSTCLTQCGEDNG
jgi:hypothetical protein